MTPLKATLGVPSVLEVNVQPTRLTTKLLGLYNSIHSSVNEAVVPPQATSLMMTKSEGEGVGVSVGVPVSVGRGVRVSVGVCVGAGVRLGAGVGSVVELACSGVPLIG